MPVRFSRMVLVAVLLIAAAPLLADSADVGKPAPDFSLVDLDGKVHKLADYKGKTVVLEWTNPGCPFVQKHVKTATMNKLVSAHPDVIFLGVNSTNADHKDYMSPDAYKAWQKEHGETLTVLYDADGKVGSLYGAKTTPHMFVIDGEGKVVYEGAIDDNPSAVFGKAEDKVTNYVDAALKAEAAGKAPDPAQTKPYGCGVKYP